ncbi:hypothetical protein EF405_06315 [Cyclobacteriaceae bacterium YHN15]|nr:hypothetical protein EF405_06315 [Cyclobacteriaceae bacterium YHN15]
MSPGNDWAFKFLGRWCVWFFEDLFNDFTPPHYSIVRIRPNFVQLRSFEMGKMLVIQKNQGFFLLALVLDKFRKPNTTILCSKTIF